MNLTYKQLESLPDLEGLDKMRRMISKYRGKSKELKEAYEDGIGAGYILALRKTIKLNDFKI